MSKDNVEEMIKEELHKNVDLSDAEYVKQYKDADNNTKAHGEKGKAPVSEARRHKRIQSNFYGIQFKYDANFFVQLESIINLLKLQNNLLMELVKEKNNDRTE